MQIQNTKNSATGKETVQFNSIEDVTKFLDTHLSAEQKAEIKKKIYPEVFLLGLQVPKDDPLSEG